MTRGESRERGSSVASGTMKMSILEWIAWAQNATFRGVSRTSPSPLRVMLECDGSKVLAISYRF